MLIHKLHHRHFILVLLRHILGLNHFNNYAFKHDGNFSSIYSLAFLGGSDHGRLFQVRDEEQRVSPTRTLDKRPLKHIDNVHVRLLGQCFTAAVPIVAARNLPHVGVDRHALAEIQTEQHDTVGNFGTDTRQFHQCLLRLVIRRLVVR